MTSPLFIVMGMALLWITWPWGVLIAILVIWMATPYRKEIDDDITESEKNPLEVGSPYDGFTVMTYNTGYFAGIVYGTGHRYLQRGRSRTRAVFDRKFERALDLFRKVDIALTQEMDMAGPRVWETNPLERLLQEGGFGNVAYHIYKNIRYVPVPLGDPQGPVLTSQAVFSRYKITQKDHKILSDARSVYNPLKYFYPKYAAQSVEIDIGGKKIIVINVHLDPDKEFEQSRQMSEVLDLGKKYTQKGFPVIIGGDFNSSPNYQPLSIRMILNEGSDVFRLAADLQDATEEALARQWTFPSSGQGVDEQEGRDAIGLPLRRYDYLFYSYKTLQYVEGSGRVMTEAAESSDHRPVMAQFRFM